MSEGLPGRVDVARLAARGAKLSNVTPVSSMTRLRDLLADDEGTVDSDLSFVIDEAGRVVVEGRVAAGVVMTCQRCLESVSVAVDVALKVAVVEDDADDGLPDGIEPVTGEAGEVSLSDLVEDELILALPLVAMHDGGGCRAAKEVAVETEPGPFAVLKKLMDDPR